MTVLPFKKPTKKGFDSKEPLVPIAAVRCEQIKGLVINKTIVAVSCLDEENYALHLDSGLDIKMNFPLDVPLTLELDDGY